MIVSSDLLFTILRHKISLSRSIFPINSIAHDFDVSDQREVALCQSIVRFLGFLFFPKIMKEFKVVTNVTVMNLFSCKKLNLIRILIGSYL